MKAFVNIMPKEPAWFRLLAKLHWLLFDAVEAINITRFRRSQPRITVIANHCWLSSTELDKLYGAIADVLEEAGLDPVFGDIMPTPGGGRRTLVRHWSPVPVQYGVQTVEYHAEGEVERFEPWPPSYMDDSEERALARFRSQYPHDETLSPDFLCSGETEAFLKRRVSKTRWETVPGGYSHYITAKQETPAA